MIVIDKFSQEAITTKYFDQLQSTFDMKNRRYEDEAKSLYCKKHHIKDIDDEPDLEETQNLYLHSFKSKVIKSALAAHKQMITFIEKNYRKEIQFSRADKYILDESPVWMMKDEKIVQNLERFPFTIPILNYLWNYNRYTRGKELQDMSSLTKAVTGGEKHITGKNKKYEYATFVTDAEFYKNMSDKIDCSKNYLQKYLIAFNKIGVIKKLGNVGRNGTLYTDGYYVPYDTTFRKQVFLKDTRAFKVALRTFDP